MFLLRFPALMCVLFLPYGVLAQPATDATVPQTLEATTLANSQPGFATLASNVVDHLRRALAGDGGKLVRAHLDDADQTPQQADNAWLRQSGYDFAYPANQQAGIALLESFNALSPAVQQQSLATVTQINQNATHGMRQQALVDAEGIPYLYFLADALGPRLGEAFINAYDKGELSKAAALIKASEVSTSAAKKHFNYSRPFLRPGNHILPVPDDIVVRDNHPYTADGGAFPSGHTNTGYTDALLMAEMIPERFVTLVDRGAKYGYSRLVLGVHYPLDVIGSRMVAERNVAHYLNDPAYRALFDQARNQLRGALEKECGTTIAQCAQSAQGDDPYTQGGMTAFYRYTMTYRLPRAEVTTMQAVTVPEGAEVLLAFPLPNLSASQRRALMVRTMIADGYPLSGGQGEQNFWQRLNLHEAVLRARAG
ncbi:phosphatase PAP2 family protein [Candidatus Sodalis sp. SoCistrobi]|uniref:acid phosphatase n=1 Tax=Candidatus Sodalis sp. SoCistrobi TaxID=1922216 RepID=UPI000A014B7C|nr:phosphatase PAP2 family protein [Candidatus Sodalis sp. SoCistrobi]